jgi:DNA-binding response OmpR family regulator
MSRILVVDDDPDILETLQVALEKQGHTVCAYDDGRVALEAARHEAPEAAILDVMLPGLNGYEVSRLLKEDIDRGDLDDFPILLVTARRVISGARQDFLASWSRADDTVWKPYDLGQLLHRVSELLAPLKNETQPSQDALQAETSDTEVGEAR